MFALTNETLRRAGAFRYALSPKDWPPTRFPDWGRAVEEAGRHWSASSEDADGAMPDLVAAEWRIVRERADVPLEQLAHGE